MYNVQYNVIGLLNCFTQCRKYRLSLPADRVKAMKEKLKASDMFKEKKSLYPET